MNDSSIQVTLALYMVHRLQSGSGHIINHLKLELLYYIHVLGYVTGTLRGNCSVECVDNSIKYQKALVVHHFCDGGICNTFWV